MKPLKSSSGRLLLLLLFNFGIAKLPRCSKEQESCVFPFEYKGITYNECTMVDSGTFSPYYWCKTKGTYGWAQCKMCEEEKASLSIATQGATATTTQSFAPGSAATKSFQSERNTTNPSEETIQLEKKNSPTSDTVIENASLRTVPKCSKTEENCVFPFEHKGITHNECTTEDSSTWFPYYWCKTEGDYGWARCEICEEEKTSPSIATQGATATTTQSFTTASAAKKSLQIEQNQNNPHKETIHLEKNTSPDPDTEVVENSSLRKVPKCSKTDENCVFPFEHKGITYNECTVADSSDWFPYYWCKTEGDYGWARCEICEDFHLGNIQHIPIS